MIYACPVVEVLTSAVGSAVSLDAFSTALICKQLLHALRFAGLLNGGLWIFGVIRHFQLFSAVRWAQLVASIAQLSCVVCAQLNIAACLASSSLAIVVASGLLAIDDAPSPNTNVAEALWQNSQSCLHPDAVTL